MRGSRASFAALLLASMARSADAEPKRAEPDGDRYQLSVHSETHAQLFRRALLPGPNGSLVSSDTALPLYEYASLSVRNLDSAWRKDDLDLELALWGRSWFDARSSEKPFDGDVQTANACFREGGLSFRLGRQTLAGGAARFIRFDGIAIVVPLTSELEATAYAGLTVLPRWNQELRYEQLGAAPDSGRRADAAFTSGSRTESWSSGGRLGWAVRERRLGLSFHEQRERGELGRRNVGLDGRTPLAGATLGLNAVLDLDRARFADARLWLDAEPARALDVSLEYLHSEPALFLSSQSVLSVFGSAAYDEAGGYANLRISRALGLEGSGFFDVYAGERPGARTELSAHCASDAERRWFVRLAYARLLGPDNGYHSVRSSLSGRLGERMTATLDAYAYLYDRAIRNYRASTVYAATLSYQAGPALQLLAGASLAHSPYANFDAQGQLRVTYAFDREAEPRRP